jgi:hypothetical protein
MKGHGEKFGRKQESAISMLLISPTIAAAAEKIGVSEASIHRWLKNEQFSARYREARNRMLDAAVNQLRLGASKAVLVLLTVAGDSKAPAGARVGAAKAIIDSALRAQELLDLEERITQLEKSAAEMIPQPERRGDPT